MPYLTVGQDSLFDRSGASKPSKPSMPAARVYRPLITGAGLAMAEESGVKKRTKKSKELFSYEQTSQPLNQTTRRSSYVNGWRQLQDQGP
jgi:ribosome modulation factor